MDGAASFEIIEVPVKLHLVTDPSGYYATRSGVAEAQELLKRANEIWSRAGIYLRIIGSASTAVSSRFPIDVGSLFIPDEFADEVRRHVNFVEGAINVFLVRQVGNPRRQPVNGRALRHLDSVFISDKTSVKGYRTTAHEIGHLLIESGHPADESNLMARGVNGENLSDEQIAKARRIASATYAN